MVPKGSVLLGTISFISLLVFLIFFLNFLHIRCTGIRVRNSIQLREATERQEAHTVFWLPKIVKQENIVFNQFFWLFMKLCWWACRGKTKTATDLQPASQPAQPACHITTSKGMKIWFSMCCTVFFFFLSHFHILFLIFLFSFTSCSHVVYLCPLPPSFSLIFLSFLVANKMLLKRFYMLSLPVVVG